MKNADLFPISDPEREQLIQRARDERARKRKEKEAFNGLDLLALVGSEEDMRLPFNPEQHDLFENNGLDATELREQEIHKMHDHVLFRLLPHLVSERVTKAHKEEIWRWILAVPEASWATEGVPPFSFHACALSAGVQPASLQEETLLEMKASFIEVFGSEKYDRMLDLVGDVNPYTNTSPTNNETIH